ncbi:MAG: hypothetical protein Q8Q06_04485 [bacterium]|nr:hypothetical protein [bacterium]
MVLKNSKINFITGLILATILFAMPLGVFAQEEGGNELLPGTPITLQSIQNSVRDIAQFMIYIGALIAIIFIVYGGIKYMSAGPNATQAAAARDIIKNGLIGAIVVAGVGTLLATAKYILNFLTGSA